METAGNESNEIVFEGMHCRLTLQRPRAGVVVVRISGQDVGEFGAAPMEALAGLMEEDPSTTLFIDARSVRGATLDVSNDWARWLAQHRPGLQRINMLTRSRFVRITAEFVRRFAGLEGLMCIYTDALAFDEELAREAAGPLA